MTQNRRFTQLWRRRLATAAAATTLLAATAVPSAAQPIWQTEPTPPENAWLAEVVNLPEESWAFGATESGHSLAVRRTDGGDWQRVEIPDVGVIQAATVENSNQADIWAVGEEQLLHFADGTWETLPLPTPPPGKRRTFTSVDAYLGPWLVGAEYGSDGSAQGILLEWDGEKWLENPLPDVGPNWGLEWVQGANSKEAWAAGWRRDGGRTQPVLLYKDASGWFSEEKVPAVEGNAWFMSALYIGHYDVWLAGAQTTASGVEPLVMHLDGMSSGDKWRPVNVPADRGARLRAAGYANTSGDLYFAGLHDTDEAGYVLRCGYSDADCVRVPGPSVDGGHVVLNDLGRNPGLGSFAVGSVRTPSLHALAAFAPN